MTSTYRVADMLACQTPTGRNAVDGPPFVAVWREIGEWPCGYATQNELFVLQPRREGDHVVVPESVPVTSRFLGMIQGVGGTSFATTSGDETFFTWTQVCDKRAKGTPTCVGVCDHDTGTVTKRPRRVCPLGKRQPLHAGSRHREHRDAASCRQRLRKALPLFAQRPTAGHRRLDA